MSIATFIAEAAGDPQNRMLPYRPYPHGCEHRAAPGLPTGTVAFLFTDIEGSTRLWETNHDAMRMALSRHDEALRQCIDAQRG